MTYYRRTISKGVILTVFLILAFATSTRAEHLTFDLKMDVFRVVDPQKTNSLVFAADVQVSIDLQQSNKWMIVYRDNNQKYVYSDSDSIVEKPNINNPTNHWYMVSDFEDGYPIDLDFDERLIWFSYLGNNYISERSGQNVPVLYGDARFDAYVHGCKMVPFFKSSDFVPDKVVFLFDADLFRKGTSKLSFEPPGDFLSNRGEQFKNFLGGHTNDQVVGSYEVTQWADCGRLRLSGAWEFCLYWYGQKTIVCVGTAQNFRIDQGELVLPVVAQKSRVYDKRLRSGQHSFNSVNYDITNGIIPKADDTGAFVAKQVSKFNGEDSRQMPLRALRQTNYILTIMIVITILFSAVFLMRRNGVRKL